MDAFPELSTARLRLRELTEDDAPAYRALLPLPEVTRSTNVVVAPGTGCARASEEARSDTFVGVIRFNCFVKPWRCGGIGYEAHPDFWARA